MPTKSLKRGRPIAPAQKWAVPWESLLRGVGKTTLRVSETTPGLSRKSVAAKRKRGKRKTKQEKHTKTLAASRPKKRPQKVQGESQKRPGPRMAPRKNAKKRDARPKRAEQTKAAGHKKKKNQKNRCVCGGVLLLPELCHLKEKNKQKNKRRRRKNLRKGERAQKKTRPDINRIFPTSFGSEPPQNKAKTIAETHQKTQDQHNHPKTKVRSRKFFQKTALRGEERQKNDKRHRTGQKKHKMKKTDSISPWGEQENQAQQCVTVRLPCPNFPHPLPGLSFTASAGRGWGGVRPSRCMVCTGPRSSPQSPKNCNDHDQEGGDDCLPPSKIAGD